MLVTCKDCRTKPLVEYAGEGALVRCTMCGSVYALHGATVARAAAKPGRAAPSDAKTGAGAGGPCPFCGDVLKPGQVICLNCGFNTKTGERMPAAGEDAAEPGSRVRFAT